MRRKGPVTLEWLLSRTVAHGECRLWLGGGDRWGYGIVREGGRNIRTHRAALQLVLGRRLEPTEAVLHSCDRPSCVAPAHLSVGTVRENNWQKSARLAVNPRPKRVSAAVVASMRELAHAGATSSQIAKAVGVSIWTVRRHGRHRECDAQLEMAYGR